MNMMIKYNMAMEVRNKRTNEAHNLDEFKQKIDENQGYIKAMWCGSSECEEKIHQLTGAKSRCIPYDQEKIDDVCVCCGKPAKKLVFWGKAY